MCIRDRSYFFRRTSLNNAVHVYGVVLDGELDTDTAETAFQFRCHFLDVYKRKQIMYVCSLYVRYLSEYTLLCHIQCGQCKWIVARCV